MCPWVESSVGMWGALAAAGCCWLQHAGAGTAMDSVWHHRTHQHMYTCLVWLTLETACVLRAAVSPCLPFLPSAWSPLSWSASLEPQQAPLLSLWQDEPEGTGTCGWGQLSWGAQRTGMAVLGSSSGDPLCGLDWFCSCFFLNFIRDTDPSLSAMNSPPTLTMELMALSWDALCFLGTVQLPVFDWVTKGGFGLGKCPKSGRHLCYGYIAQTQQQCLAKAPGAPWKGLR